MRFADRNKDRKQYLYVLSSDLKRRCSSGGLKLLQTIKDINGQSVYVFSMDRLTFD